MNGRKRRALSRGAAGSPRARRGLALNLVLVALQLHVDGALGEGRDGQRERPERLAGVGPVASGPRAGRMLPEAVGGGDLEARDARVRTGGVECRFGHFCADRDVGGHGVGRVVVRHAWLVYH